MSLKCAGASRNRRRTITKTSNGGGGEEDVKDHEWATGGCGWATLGRHQRGDEQNSQLEWTHINDNECRTLRPVLRTHATGRSQRA